MAKVPKSRLCKQPDARYPGGPRFETGVAVPGIHAPNRQHWRPAQGNRRFQNVQTQRRAEPPLFRRVKNRPQHTVIRHPGRRDFINAMAAHTDQKALRRRRSHPLQWKSIPRQVYPVQSPCNGYVQTRVDDDLSGAG